MHENQGKAKVSDGNTKKGKTNSAKGKVVSSKAKSRKMNKDQCGTSSTADAQPSPMQPIELPPSANVAQPTVVQPTDLPSMLSIFQLPPLSKLNCCRMFIRQPCTCRGPTLPPQLTEANNILHHLMVVAQQVTSSRPYDWRNVAAKIGLTQNETYMDYMGQLEEAKKFCGYEDPEIAATNEEGGTQQSDLTSTKKDA
ncbi:hypothetical protein SESBI_42656 [Sesbania bispinosa]|nr:hypothetical protein SESBI_42656 [Sesbania bispinosa]